MEHHIETDGPATQSILLGTMLIVDTRTYDAPLAGRWE